jgi:hypothetical protein
MSKSLTIAALLASLTLGGCLGGTGGGQSIDLSSYERGKLHYNAGQFGLAVQHFQSAVSRKPGSIEALNGLAASYDRLGRYDLSARYYERALAADPESTQTLNNIGYSYLLQDRLDLAVAYLRDAQSRDEKDPVVLANRKTAEVSYQEADLKRSAEEARAKRFAPPASPPSRPQVAAQSPAASSARVKPWIERTAPKVQTLVTQPQVALLGAVDEVGIDPQLAAYRPQQPAAAELLPDRSAAPMLLDPRPSPQSGEAVFQELRAAPIVAPEAPRAPNRPPSVPVAGLAPAEVTVASLDPLPALEGLATETPDGTVSAVEAGLVSGSVAPMMGPSPQESLGGAIVRLLPAARDRIDAAGPAPVEVTVASLDPVRGLSDIAPSSAPSSSVATTELVAPEVALRDLDPLDALESEAFETERGLQQAAHVMEAAEVEVAALSAVAPAAPRVDAGLAVEATASLPLVEVSNGTGRLAMAARIRDHLESKGVVVKRLSNADHYRHQETTIFYRGGWRTYAEDLARMLPAVIDLDGRPGQESDVRLELGGDLLEFDRGLYYVVKRPNGGNPS